MCGIAGFWGKTEGVEPEVAARRMSDALRHRGPDDSGVWADREADVALGHRRLSILDLSPEGRQPMTSPTGRYVISYNGEIYNWADLRHAVESAAATTPRFRGHSDTEVLLHALEVWGLEGTLERSVGMFSFALWDREERALHLARDRMGEKPLYCGWNGGVFLFASELKALRAHPAWRGEVDRQSLDMLLRYDFIPAPWSIYSGIFKVRPGAVVTLRPFQERRPGERIYWSARDVFESGAHDPYRGTPQEATGELEALLRTSIARQMVADVPLGALLSGGYDSSLVVALMQSLSSRPIRTFTVGFPDPRTDESGYARRVAAHLGTSHTEIRVDESDALDVVPRLASIYDEPFGDSSQIPTFLVMQLARRDVTVALSGDGGDELFGGYQRYVSGGRSIAGIRRLLGGTRGGAASVASRALQAWGTSGEGPTDLGRERTLHRVWNVVSRLDATSDEAAYHASSSRWKEPGSPVEGIGGARRPLVEPDRWARMRGRVPMMMYQDAVGYLPDDILVKVDRASMAVSLESRAPLLDHHLVEFAARLPLAFKIREGESKWLTRQVLYRYVPPDLVDRPKRGFGPPIGDWLRGAFRDWADSLLSEDRIRSRGFFRPALIHRMWRQHLAGSALWTGILWNVLMFESWAEESGNARGSRDDEVPARVAGRTAAAP